MLESLSDKLGGFETRPYISIRKYFQEPVLIAISDKPE